MRAKQAPKAKRLRRTPEAVRSAALQAARSLLLKSGPEAITLPAVAKELGMAHGNITHHFGSVGALHASLADQMGQEFATAVQSAVAQLRNENADPVDVVDAVFDAFNDTGAGRLISWLASTNNMAALEPWFEKVAKAVRELAKGAPKPGEQRQSSVKQTALVLLSTALGNALIGDRLHAAVGLPKGTLNELSAKDLVRRAYPSKH
jgi:TetR/AcrR family transcriptional regulator, repressor for neighboring sulfatase